MVAAYVFIRFLQPKFTIGVVGVLLNDQGQVLLVKHVFHPQLPWGLPGGWINRHEEPTTAVAREIMEELQLKVTNTELLYAQLGPNHRNHLDMAYLCTWENEVGQLSKELLTYGWYTIDEMPRLTKFHYKAILRAIEINSSGKSV